MPLTLKAASDDAPKGRSDANVDAVAIEVRPEVSGRTGLLEARMPADT